MPSLHVDDQEMIAAARPEGCTCEYITHNTLPQGNNTHACWAFWRNTTCPLTLEEHRAAVPQCPGEVKRARKRARRRDRR